MIDYRVRTSQALAAVDLRQGLGSWACLEIRGGVGLAYASDRDDHLLRGRLSEGHGWGYALDGRAELQLLPGRLPGPLTLSLLGDVRYTSTEGDVDQRWYRDEDLPAGTEINDIPYEIRSTHWFLGIRLGAAFR